MLKNEDEEKSVFKYYRISFPDDSNFSAGTIGLPETRKKVFINHQIFQQFVKPNHNANLTREQRRSMRFTQYQPWISSIPLVTGNHKRIIARLNH